MLQQNNNIANIWLKTGLKQPVQVQKNLYYLPYIFSSYIHTTTTGQTDKTVCPALLLFICAWVVVPNGKTTKTKTGRKIERLDMVKLKHLTESLVSQNDTLNELF